ncbi:MAG: cytochrome C [Nitrospirae bacterium]|nr:cytochrome C [Nitrospirota bacterium]
MAGGSSAFHDGGAGSCIACHSLHGTDIASTGGPSLLREQDTSSSCLYCHQGTGDSGPTSYHVSTPVNELPLGVPPKQLTPGGDFGWLKKSYTWSPGGESRGEQHGHNIVAADFLYSADGIHAAAPGGSYPADGLSCISCHDPHGRYRRDIGGSISTSVNPIVGSGSLASSPDPGGIGSVGVYRLLGGKGYQPKSVSGAVPFVNDPPAAVAPDDYNRSEATTQTRVAYGAGMSEWCMNCHSDYSVTMHTVVASGSGTSAAHPVGASGLLGTAIADTYNAYVKSGDLTGLSSASYLSLVPFEEGITVITTLKGRARSDDSVLSGPDATTAQVTCLTCHRAHASGWDSATRWNTKSNFIVYGGYYAPAANPEYAQGRTEAEAARAYYDRPVSMFALNQDSLCNKCHNGNY